MFFCPANTQQSPRLPPDLWRSGSRDGYHGEGHLPEQMVQLPDIGPGETDPDTPPRGSVAGLRYHSHFENLRFVPRNCPKVVQGGFLTDID